MFCYAAQPRLGRGRRAGAAGRSARRARRAASAGRGDRRRARARRPRAGDEQRRLRRHARQAARRARKWLATAPPDRTGDSLYLHGFRSSPASVKARQLVGCGRRAARATRARAARPDAAHVRAGARWPRRSRGSSATSSARRRDTLTFVGSSLGGFYATHLAERFGARAVLVNPAMRPYDDLRPYVGPQTNLYTGETFVVTQAHFDELARARGRAHHASRALLPAGRRPATKCSTIARRSRSTAARSSIVRRRRRPRVHRASTRRFRRSCASPAWRADSRLCDYNARVPARSPVR